MSDPAEFYAQLSFIIFKVLKIMTKKKTTNSTKEFEFCSMVWLIPVNWSINVTSCANSVLFGK